MSFLNTIGHILNPFESTPQKIGAIALNNLAESTANQLGDGYKAELIEPKILPNGITVETPYNPTESQESAKKEQENTEKEIDGNTDSDFIKELWERQEQAVKRREEREDTAYQRAVKDMRKAGINPNLTGVTQASSNAGAGIESSTAGESLSSTQLTTATEKFLTELKIRTDIDQKEKDRIANFLTSTLNNITKLGTAMI